MLGAAPLPVGGKERDLLLDVVINGRSIGLLADLHERDHRLYATRKELRAIGLKPPGDAASGAADGDAQLVSLADIPGLTYRMDEATQTLYVTAKTQDLVPAQLAPDALQEAASAGVESSTGGILNYNLVGTRAGGQTYAEGLIDARAFSRWGVAATGLLLQSDAAGAGTQAGPAVRLDTTYTYSDPGSLRRYRAGDFISGGLSWTRPLRLGGLQVTTDYSMRPDLVTFPIPTISGQVAVPSSVDVLVNGVQQLAREVQPGPFEIRQLPVVTGAGNISVVTRDALGQQVTQTLPFYASSTLLAAGLSSFAAEIGAVREQYGTLSNDYNSVAGSLTYRRGVADWLTLQGHGEASAGVAMAGGGAALAMGRFGVLSMDAAASRSSAHGGGRGGGLVSAGFERIAPVVSLTASVQLADKGFRDVAASRGEPVPQLLARASIGLSLGWGGTLGIAYTALQRPASAALAAPQIYGNLGTATDTAFSAGTYIAPATRTSLLSASYSRGVLGGRAFFYATGFGDLAAAHSTGAVAGLTMPLGGRGSVGISGGMSGGQATGSLQASQSSVSAGDYGWQGLASTGQTTRALALGEYKTPWALVGAGVDRSGGQTSLRSSAEGALSFADGHVFASNTIQDSFAVVDTDGAPGVQVLQENRPVGRTNSAGLLLVPDMRSFEANRLGIDARDVPLDVEVGETMRLVRPQDRSGVVVSFPVHSSRGAIVRLVDQAGRDLPLGSTVTLRGGKRAVSVGYDGETFLTGLGKKNTIDVSLPKGELCTASFGYAATAGALPKIGPVTCRSEPAR